MSQYVEGGYREFTVKERLKLRKYLIHDIREFYKLSGMLPHQRIPKSS